MESNITLFKATFNKSVWLLKRYLFNTVMLLVGLYVLFVMLFVGGKEIAPTVVADSLGPLIVGYFVWIMATKAYQETSSDITREAQWGTLEQLHLTPYGIGRVVIFTSLVNVLITLLMGGAMLLAMLLTLAVLSSGVTLQIDLLTVVPLTILTVLPVIGLGLFFGGLALLYKRVGEVASLMQLLFIVFSRATRGRTSCTPSTPTDTRHHTA